MKDVAKMELPEITDETRRYLKSPQCSMTWLAAARGAALRTASFWHALRPPIDGDEVAAYRKEQQKRVADLLLAIDDAMQEELRRGLPR